VINAVPVQSRLLYHGSSKRRRGLMYGQ